MWKTVIAVGVLFSALSTFWIQEKETRQPPRQDENLRQDDSESVSRRDFMRTKLMYSKNVFEGLTTGDFQLIRAGVEEIKGITEATQWVAIDNEDYRRLTREFETTVKRLEAAAQSENLEATALRYYQMSTSCIDCHSHIRIAKYEL